MCGAAQTEGQREWERDREEVMTKTGMRNEGMRSKNLKGKLK